MYFLKQIVGISQNVRDLWLMMLQNVVFCVTIRISPTFRVLTRYYFPSVVTFLLPFTFTSTGFLRSSPAGRSPRQGSDAGVPRGRAHRGAGTGALSASRPCLEIFIVAEYTRFWRDQHPASAENLPQ